MRRRFLVLVLVGLSGALGCGLSAIATGGFDAPVDGGPDPDSTGPRADGAGPESAPSVDAAPDAGAIDAEADRPDAGVIFRPTHILPVYSLTAADVTITMQSGINTTTGFIALNGAPAALSPDIVMTDGVAVWSVGALTVNAKLLISGDQPLVIVAARDVTISQTVSAYGDVAKPGPGGFAAAAGAGKGASGAKTANDASGGGGAGHGTAGGAGADKAAVKGGLAGGGVNPGDTVLTGGAGGGNGGGFALGTCGDQGRGGVGGGAIQISAVGKIRVTGTGGIDVGGGGGAGGCRNNGGQAFSGGGGGGAGGLVVLESVGGVELDVGSAIAASGGGGGGGGDSNANGTPGDPGSYPTGVAQGGTGGGSGGAGGVGGPFNSPPAPGAVAGVSGGGGGGATGRVFLRTRTAAALIVAGTVAARQTDDPTF